MAEGIGLLDLASGMSRRGVSIAPESALFIALQVAEALRDAPGAVSVGAVRITGEGVVDVPARTSLDERAAIESVASVCDALLSPPTAPLRALLERVRKGDIVKIDALRAEIDALLVPLNRGAAKRVLGRFVREHLRVAGDAPSAEAPKQTPIAAPPSPPKSPEPAPVPVVEAKPAAPARPPVVAAKPATPARPPVVEAKAPAPPVQASAVDTSPDSVPPRVSPLPAAATPGKSATDTEPDASVGITAMLSHPLGDSGRPSHENLTNPRIPGPPSLGSLTEMPAMGPNADVEPDAYLPQSKKSSTKPSAVDTAIDAQVLAPSRSSAATDSDLGIVQPRRSGSRVVLVIAFASLFVALSLLAFALTHR